MADSSWPHKYDAIDDDLQQEYNNAMDDDLQQEHNNHVEGVLL